MLEINCMLCENCTGNSCVKYGENPDEAVTRCANDRFKNYKQKRIKHFETEKLNSFK